MGGATLSPHPAACAVSGPLFLSAWVVACWGSRGRTIQSLMVAPPGTQSQDCIAAALACSKILKELSKEEEDTDSLEEMLALADEYEQRAIGELLGPQPQTRALMGDPGVLAPSLCTLCCLEGLHSAAVCSFPW